jgi:hypothetical protein
VREFTWRSRNEQGTAWSLHCGVVLLGSVYLCPVDKEWRCNNYRFRSGMQTGLFPTVRDAAKWLLGYDMRPVKGLKKHGD